MLTDFWAVNHEEVLLSTSPQVQGYKHKRHSYKAHSHMYLLRQTTIFLVCTKGMANGDGKVNACTQDPMCTHFRVL